jgi:hypothetical protein
MKLEIERIYPDNKILRAIESGFSKTLNTLSNEIKNFNIPNLIEDVGYEAEWLDLAVYFTDEIKGHINDLIKAYQNIGTYNSYKVLLKSFFGDNSDIEILNPSKGVLNITITTNYLNQTILDKDKTQELNDSQGNKILAKNITEGLSTEQLLAILKKIIPIGIVVNYTII